MSYLIILSDGLIAILMVVITWRAAKEHRDLKLVLCVIVLFATRGVFEMLDARNAAKERAAQAATQGQMSEALKTLRTNSEEDRNKRIAELQYKQEGRAQLSALLERGIAVREQSCPSISAVSAERQWTSNVEQQLSGSQKVIFKKAETSSGCYQSMSIKLGALEKIMDEYQ